MINIKEVEELYKYRIHTRNSQIILQRILGCMQIK